MCNFNATGVAEYYGLYLERNYVDGGWTLGQYRGKRLYKVLTFAQVQDKVYITALCIEWAQ